MRIKVLTDSSCDLPYDFFMENSNILELLGMPVCFGEEEFVDDLGNSLSHDYLYRMLREGVFPKTSQINVTEFLELFRKCHLSDQGVIYIGLSSALSGTYNNAVLAKELLLEEYTDAKITIIDTYAASVGLGLLVKYVVEMVKEHKSYDDIVSWIEENKLKINHWFAIDDLIHLKNGGRIPATTAYVGTALKVKPILTVVHNGKLETYAKVRGRIKSLKFLIAKLYEHTHKLEDKHLIIGHADCIEDAEKIKNMIMDNTKFKSIIVSKLSATIATHVGPGMIAISFLGDQLREEI